MVNYCGEKGRNELAIRITGQKREDEEKEKESGGKKRLCKISYGESKASLTLGLSPRRERTRDWRGREGDEIFGPILLRNNTRHYTVSELDFADNIGIPFESFRNSKYRLSIH